MSLTPVAPFARHDDFGAVAQSRSVGQRWRGGFDALFGCNFERAFERVLNFPSCCLPRVPVRHDARPFDDLGDESIRLLFPQNTKCGFHSREDGAAWVFSSWFQIQILQFLPHLAYLIGLCFSTGGRLQIQETRSALKDDVAAFRLARILAELGQRRLGIVQRGPVGERYALSRPRNKARRQHGALRVRPAEVTGNPLLLKLRVFAR